jgi:hypothetical protein
VRGKDVLRRVDTNQSLIYIRSLVEYKIYTCTLVVNTSLPTVSKDKVLAVPPLQVDGFREFPSQGRRLDGVWFWCQSSLRKAMALEPCIVNSLLKAIALEPCIVSSRLKVTLALMPKPMPRSLASILKKLEKASWNS